jgi:ECF sigma factor
MEPLRDVMALLGDWSRGNPSALSRLLPLVDQELRLIANRQVKRERAVTRSSRLRSCRKRAGLYRDLARIVELRAFGGLTIERAACVLNVSSSTDNHEWRPAKAWLGRELGLEPQS